MDLFPSPHVAVLEVFQDIDLPGSFWGISFPSAPVTVIVEIILPRAGLKDSVSGYGPGKFVFEGGHGVVLISFKNEHSNPIRSSILKFLDANADIHQKEKMK